MPSSLFALLDDIATVLDDVAILTKIAAKKTAGVLGDDLALNAQQVSGVTADRELPVVWAVAKGSAVNKAILAPVALGISAFAPWFITPLLMVGGAYLCFEGVEKLAHKLLHGKDAEKAHHAELKAALEDSHSDFVALEKQKIKGAVRTDFVLSAEIIVIALGSVAAAPFATQVMVVCSIAAIMTVGVYGFVAGVVKLDDLGLHLSRSASPRSRAVGGVLLKAAPYLMKSMSIAGTVAMFLVGGGILVHGIPPVHHELEHLAHAAGLLGALVQPLGDGLFGVVAGAVVLAVVSLVNRLRRKK
jgi:predicted DNA repair protein MutK